MTTDRDQGRLGRFAHNWHSDELQMANENVQLSSRFLWHDLNDNKLFDPGEINFDRRGAGLRLDEPLHRRRGRACRRRVEPDVKEPMSNEFSMSLERQLMPSFAVRATGIYSRQQVFRVQNNLRPYSAYNIPITRPDPGPDGVLGTADDPGTIDHLLRIPGGAGGAQFQQPMLVNGTSADDQKYTTFEFAASKRLDRRWMMMASYSTRKSIFLTGRTRRARATTSPSPACRCS